MKKINLLIGLILSLSLVSFAQSSKNKKGGHGQKMESKKTFSPSDSTKKANFEKHHDMPKHMPDSAKHGEMHRPMSDSARKAMMERRPMRDTIRSKEHEGHGGHGHEGHNH